MDVFCIVNKTIKLTDPSSSGKYQLQTPLAYDNSLAHAIRATVLKDDGTPEDLSTVDVYGSFMRADGKTVTPILGTVTGNAAQIILPASCYVVPGRFKCTINLAQLANPEGISEFDPEDDYSKGDNVVYGGIVFQFTSDHTGAWTGEDVAVVSSPARTAFWVEGYVERNISNELIDPGTPVGNIPQAIGAANAAASAATAAAASAITAASQASAYGESIAPDYDDLEFPIEAWKQVCWHEGGLYVNTADISTAEAWTNAHWLATDISQLLNRRVATADVATVAEAKTYLGI